MALIKGLMMKLCRIYKLYFQQIKENVKIWKCRWWCLEDMDDYNRGGDGL